MKMIHAIRSVRNHPIQRSFSSSSPVAAPVLSKRACSIRFKGDASLSSQQESAHVMDKAENPETGDVMYHSFGHEYATRCEDEGFGVVHSTKQSETDDTHESQPGTCGSNHLARPLQVQT
ncbi:uncharacterized protein LOC115752539 isoform X2 [Rhodamnia argentea]|uniref:Uncharacterized protein LOC115752539 isoform X2 n=1 Tax=Rhodamnia argentea TaxID=178133 RepID=A0ABM3HRB4_9MYRT|nr:uncharacterized protein LOC115752539 isoform X2 [Rhodamnia argentea]